VAIAAGLPAPPCEAVIEEVPEAIPVANPELAEIVATAVLEDDQATDLVTSCIVPSLYVPAALYCREVPVATCKLTGVTAIDFRVAAVTVTFAAPLVTPFTVALTWAEPELMPRTNPEPIPTVAVLLFVEAQVALEVTSCWLPSLNVPSAANC